MDDFDYSDDSCPSCRYSQTHFRNCDDCENGRIDISDENFEVEGTTYQKCETCNGHGIEHWCPKCGYDLTLER